MTNTKTRRGTVHIAYDAGKRPYHEPIADLVANRLPWRGTYLDVGCGNGWLVAAVRQRRPLAIIVAGDADPECQAATAALDVDAWVVHLDLRQRFKWPTAVNQQSYDVVTLSHVVEHCPEPIAVLTASYELLAPGGTLIVAVPNPSRPAILWGNLRRHDYANRGHIYSWDPSHWRRFIETACGFENKAVITYAYDAVRVCPNRLPGSRRINRWLLREMPWWSSSNIAQIQKPAS